MCKVHNISESEKITRLPEYCTRLNAQFIRSRPEWHAGQSQLSSLLSILKNRYRAQDYEQQVNRREYLEAYKSVKGGGGGGGATVDVEEYVRTFTAISENLIRRDMLDRYTQWEWFLEGLPDEDVVRECVVGGVEFQSQGVVKVDFENMCVRAIKASRAKSLVRGIVKKGEGVGCPQEVVTRAQSLKPEKGRGLVHVEGTYPIHAEGMSHKYTQPPAREGDLATTEDFEKLSSSIKTLESLFGTVMEQRKSETSASTFASHREENLATKDDLERLSGRIQSLELEIQTLVDQRKSEASVPVFTPPTGSQADSLSKTSSENDYRTPYQQPEQEKQTQEQQVPQQVPQTQPQPQTQPPEQEGKQRLVGRFPFNRCLYCYGENHRRQTCPDFKYDVARGAVHINSRNKLSLGRPSGDGQDRPDVPLLPGQRQRDIVTDLLKKESVAHSVSKPQDFVEVRARSTVIFPSSPSWRNEPTPRSEPKESPKPSEDQPDDDQTKQESESEPPQPELERSPESGPEPVAETETERKQPSNYRSPTVSPEEESTTCSNHHPPASSEDEAEEEEGEETDSDLPSLKSCSTTTPDPDSETKPPNHHTHTHIRIYDQGLRSAEEAILHMRSMETVGVEEFSVRSKQPLGGPPRPRPRQTQSDSRSSASRSLSQARSSGEVSTATATGGGGGGKNNTTAKKKKKGKRKNEIQETVVNTGDVGIQARYED